MRVSVDRFACFFFNDTATTEIYTLSLHDALPIFESIIASRCAMCHAAEPLWPGMASPPKDVVLETQAQIRLRAEAIGLQAVHTLAMPPGNITDIPDEERRRLPAWIAAGPPGWVYLALRRFSAGFFRF